MALRVLSRFAIISQGERGGCFTLIACALSRFHVAYFAHDAVCVGLCITSVTFLGRAYSFSNSSVSESNTMMITVVRLGPRVKKIKNGYPESSKVSYSIDLKKYIWCIRNHCIANFSELHNATRANKVW